MNTFDKLNLLRKKAHWRITTFSKQTNSLDLALCFKISKNDFWKKYEVVRTGNFLSPCWTSFESYFTCWRGRFLSKKSYTIPGCLNQVLRVKLLDCVRENQKLAILCPGLSSTVDPSCLALSPQSNGGETTW